MKWIIGVKESSNNLIDGNVDINMMEMKENGVILESYEDFIDVFVEEEVVNE